MSASLYRLGLAVLEWGCVCALVGSCAAAARGGVAPPSPERTRDERLTSDEVNAEEREKEVHGEDVLVLDVNLRARRLIGGSYVLLERLQSGAVLYDEDQLQILVKTAHDAHLHVAFCSAVHTRPGAGELSIYPPAGAIAAARHRVTFVPGRQKDIVLDKRPGAEVLYLIVSRVPLSMADESLANAIRGAQGSANLADCRTLQQAIHVDAPSRANQGKPGRPPPKLEGDVARSPGAAPAALGVDFYAGPTRPVGSAVRGAYVEDRREGGGPIRADSAGIVVLRYELKHERRAP